MQDGSGNLSALLAVLRYQQLREEELVGQTPDLRASLAVDFIAAADES